MADPVTEAIARLDGRDPNAPGRPTLRWRLTKLYKRVKSEAFPLGPSKTPVRKEGGSDSNPGTPGAEWNTPSSLDEVTVLAEIFTQVYVDGKGVEHTGFDLLAELYRELVEKKTS